MRIAIMGAGAVGGYVGAHMVAAGHDVVFIDAWQAHVDAIRDQGLTIRHLRDVPDLTVQAQAVTDVSRARGPFDIAFISVKSYDTVASTAAIAPLLAKDGFVVSLQNGLNEDAIASVVGADRVLGAIASSITVELVGPGLVRRASGKQGAAHTVFRVGEMTGGASDRARQVGKLLELSDSTTVTDSLLDERWTKLIINAMGNGIAAATGLVSRDAVADDRIRGVSARLGSEAVRVAQGLGRHLGEILHLDPETIARAGEGDPEAKATFDAQRLADTQKPGGGAHLPSMGQDIAKGRRTEIEFLNGLVVTRGRELGIPTPVNAALVEVVKKVEAGQVPPAPDLIWSLA
ncbi:2-dehydropantoate 2-reductase [Rhodovarius crocodyli]|uniref:2-dehydropantoate 2-reductase n=1 Tax=Rhodovarius crocodyli TaxID=1979269 RepID=A0A437MED8_9PROT|nr:2-dehydropantoate 2-reductase [Rhodovarius crocodyli]RVT96014.1 2-dehydropantoate 2-reductase [Rhodovarius crocodyli]